MFAANRVMRLTDGPAGILWTATDLPTASTGLMAAVHRPRDTVHGVSSRGRNAAGVGVLAAVVALAACTSTHRATTSTTPTNSPAPSADPTTAVPSTASPSAAASSQLPSASAEVSSSAGLPAPDATGPLHVSADVAIKGQFTSAQIGLFATQAPDGAVFVAGVGSPQVIWVVDGVRPAAVAEHVTGPVSALAADTSNLYVGAGQSVTAYSRTTGELVRRWTPSPVVGAVDQLVVAGDRVWALYSQLDGNQPSPPGDLVEFDPAASSPVTHVRDVSDTFSIAAGPAGIYYVTKQSTEIVERTNDGRVLTAPTRQAVDLELSGPSAIQAVAVDGGRVVVQHNAGQGLDAVLNTYDAATLAGPSKDTNFAANEGFAVTPSGIFVIGNSDTNVCGAGQTTCLRRFSLTAGNVGDPVALPADTAASTLTGPFPTVVLALGPDLHVVRIS
jgi:hypothetical protein